MLRYTVFAITFAIVTLILFTPISTTTYSDGLGEGEVEFEADSYSSGDIAVFLIKDSTLGTSGSCVGTWTSISATIGNFVDWNLASGSPLESDYSLNSDCNFDTVNPSNSPVIWFRNPLPQLTINSIPTLYSVPDENEAAFQLTFVTNASSTVEMAFSFDVPDSYSMRAKVTSESDTNGERIQIVEVASETDSTASPTSGLFRGEVGVSTDDASLATGDSLIYVQAGDSLQVTYMDETMSLPLASDIASLNIPTPTLTGTPTSTPIPTITPSPTATSTPTFTPTATPQICEFSETTEPVIKGNINSSGEKIYHTPNSPSYDLVAIDESKGERFFCTVAEAEDAGWRLPFNQISTPTPVPAASTVAIIILAGAFFAVLTWRLWSKPLTDTA